jgi:vanillate O-demethylase ferredoxin subunit
MAGALEAAGASFELHCYARGAMPLREYIESQPYRDRVTFHDSGAGDSLRAGPPAWQLAPEKTVVYACGPAGFLEAARAHATAAGVAEAAFRSERFQLEEPIDLTGDTFTVIAASTGERMAVADGETIAEVLERHGYEVTLSCEQGICGSCLTGVLAGTPDHRDEVQTPAEHAANTQINVCVSRARSASLTLDV